MTKVVVGIAGRIATGKSTFMQGVAVPINAVVVSFGDYVREQARECNCDSESREVLQSLGEQLKRDLGDEEFVRRVLARAPDDGNVVVDGVRHVEVANMIERLVSPRRFCLVYLELDEVTRRVRAEQRRPNDAARLDQFALHPTEIHVHDGSLKARADLVLNAANTVEQLVDETVIFLEAHLAGTT